MLSLGHLLVLGVFPSGLDHRRVELGEQHIAGVSRSVQHLGDRGASGVTPAVRSAGMRRDRTQSAIASPIRQRSLGSALSLYRRAWNGPLGAEHATITWLGVENCCTVLARIEELAGIFGHNFGLRRAAMGACQYRFGHQTHFHESLLRCEQRSLAMSTWPGLKWHVGDNRGRLDRKLTLRRRCLHLRRRGQDAGRGGPRSRSRDSRRVRDCSPSFPAGCQIRLPGSPAVPPRLPAPRRW